MSLIQAIKNLLSRPLAPIKLTPFQERLIKSRRAVRKSLKARTDAKRTIPERIADWMTATFGSISFLMLNVVLFTAWLLINVGYFSPTIEPFDPFPFGLLTTAVSLEAIILAIFVLISQNREQKVSSIREEVDMEIDIIAESELTKVMEIVGKIAKKNGIDIDRDEEFQEMLKPLNRNKLEKLFEKGINTIREFFSHNYLLTAELFFASYFNLGREKIFASFGKN